MNSLYIHIPWCVKKCPYCDFNSHPNIGQLPESEYAYALQHDLRNDLKLKPQQSFESIYFGGGTPSLFSAKTIGSILCHVNSMATITDKAEITMELNPGTVEHDSIKSYRTVGINRISVGAQSFNQQHLAKLGRIHQTHDTINVVKQLHDQQMNFNLDIMYGLPEQSIDQAMEDLQMAIDCAPNHISWYNLTLEPGTQFHLRPPKLPVDDDIFQIEVAGRQLLQAAGYLQYEVSAYAKPGQQCQHNLNYWKFGDYFGVGAGAHSKLTLADNKIIRLAKHRIPRHYLTSGLNFIEQKRELKSEELPFEFMLNNLRLYEKIPLQRFTKATGVDSDFLKPYLLQAQYKDLMDYNSHYCWTTNKGKLFINEAAEIFL